MRYSLKYNLLIWVLFFSAATATTINVPADYATIQAALTAADSSDTVLVQPDTYYEKIIWPDVNGIKLISAGDSSNTVIDGSGNGRVIYLNPSTATIDSTTEIQGFRITNGGNIASGGGMFVSNASPVLTRLWVTGNTATTDDGGGLYIYSGSPTLTDVTVSGNTAYSDGGGLYIDSGSPTLIHVTVTGNTATDDGGGLSIVSGSSTLTDVTVTGNTAYLGGGLYIDACSPTLTDVTVIGNTAYLGGGLSIYGGSPKLTNVTVTSNTASYRGGGLSIYSGSPTLTDMTVSGNTAPDGGGLSIVSSSPTLRDVTVSGNTAYSDGGGLYIHHNSSPTLMDVTVTGNTASYRGGGFFIEDSYPTLTRITVSKNLGAGLFFKAGSSALVNVTITGNTSGIYVESGTPTIAGSNIAYNGAGLYNADNTNIIEASNNWWGDSSGPYHPLHNDGGLGDSVNTFVNITPFLIEPDTVAPPIPVQNLVVTNQGEDFIFFAWDTSPIVDLAGYKIYFDTDSIGFPYADTIDVGNNTSYTLSGLSTGLKYYIAATCYDTDGNESWYSNEVSATPTALAVEESSYMPTSFALHPAYPNPFNPTTTIRFDLPHAVDIGIVVYDLLGREVARLVDRDMIAGYHQVMWNGRDSVGREVPTGIYIARMATPEYIKTIKMIMMK